MSDSANNSKEFSELDWIEIRKNQKYSVEVGETAWQRTVRKTKENPFVPLGCTATVAALCYGVYSFTKGNTMMSQYMMRTRVVAQSFTIIAIVSGLIMSTKKL